MTHRLRNIFASILIRLPLGCALLALLAGTVLDRGADGGLRASLFPLALTCFDPLIWTCAWGSLLVAALSAAGSIILGTLLALATQTRWYWGRPLLGFLIVLPLAIPPAISAGVWQASGITRSVWVTDSGGALMDLTPWLLWLVGSLGWGTALVAAVASARLAHIDPAAIEVARSLGLGHWTRWRLLVRPTIRPAVAQAGSLVFSMVVFDPGPALVLGLRRSLAYEAIRSLPLIGGTPRAFAIGVGMTVVCLFAHFVVFRPGQRSPEATIPKQIPPLRQLRSGFTIPLLIGLATWSGLALTTVPLLFLALSARNFDQSFGINITGSLLFATALGIAAVMGSGWLVGRDEKAVSRPLPVRIVLPPLVVGLGVLALGPFSRDLIGFVQQLGMGGSAADPFRHVAPKLIQAVGLVVAMGIAWLPWVRAGSVSTRYLAFLAAFAVSSAAPMIGFGSNQGLTTLGVLLVELPGDSRGFLGIATFSVVMNLVALSAVCLDKRCHVGDRLV